MPGKKIGPLGWLGIALVMAIAIMTTFGILSVTSDGGYYGMMGTGAAGWGIAMMAIPGAILVFVLLAAVVGLREESALVPTVPALSPTNPLEVLDQRYARGELNRDEYLRIRADLTMHPSSP
jgi:putative membrane protein